MSEEAKIISDLCKISLETKWYKGSDEELMHRCPFCNQFNLNCSVCICPPEICGGSGYKGYVSELVAKYGEDLPVNSISDEELEHMCSLFKKYIIEDGKI